MGSNSLIHPGIAVELEGVRVRYSASEQLVLDIPYLKIVRGGESCTYWCERIR